MARSAAPLAWPSRLEEGDQRADAGDAARQRPRAGAVVAARGHEGADVGGGKRAHVGERRRIAEMAGEEAQELHDVARIGFHRLVGQPPLAGQMPPPALDGLGEAGRGDNQWGIGGAIRAMGEV